MKLVFFGTPEFSVPCLERLLADERFQVLGVVTQPDKRRARGNALLPSPVKQVVLTAGLPVWQPVRLRKDPEVLATLAALQADVFVVVAYGQILSPQVLAMPRLACINVHGSLLPEYRGAAPIQWSLVQGRTETGVTTMLMDEGMDTGAMLLKRNFAIDLFDNAQTVAERMAAVGADLLVETLLQIQGPGVIPEPQNADLATYAPLIKKEDYGLDWRRSALALHNQVRGFYPNCFCLFREQSLKILSTAPISISAEESGFISFPEPLRNALSQVRFSEFSVAEPGRIVFLLKGIGPLIQTGDGYLLLREVQLAGKRSQSGSDFVNGLHLNLSEVLGSPL